MMRIRLVAILGAVACGANGTSGTPTRTPPAGGPLVTSCCAGNDSALMAQMRQHDTTPEARRTPELAVFPYRTTSGIAVRDRIIVRDAASWSKIWLTLVGSHSPVPPTPAADFARETIVVASMGQRSHGGYSIAIDSAGIAGDTVVLAITETSPGAKCGTTAALTSPVAVARVLRPNATIRFVEKTNVFACD